MSQVHKSIVLTALAISMGPIFLFTTGNSVFALEYSNYTSEKYGIQFEYPSNWTVTEKTSRFDDGSDISIKPPQIRGAMMSIDYYDAITLLGTSDIEDATKNLIPILKRSMMGYDVRTIEEPHLITIDNKTAGTVVLLGEQKYVDNPIKIANQMWIVIIDSNAYLIVYLDSPSKFDSPENTEVRENFIKSIKFLGDKESQQKSRFE